MKRKAGNTRSAKMCYRLYFILCYSKLIPDMRPQANPQIAFFRAGSINKQITCQSNSKSETLAYGGSKAQINAEAKEGIAYLAHRYSANIAGIIVFQKLIVSLVIGMRTEVESLMGFFGIELDAGLYGKQALNMAKIARNVEGRPRAVPTGFEANGRFVFQRTLESYGRPQKVCLQRG